MKFSLYHVQKFAGSTQCTLLPCLVGNMKYFVLSFLSNTQKQPFDQAG